MWKTQDLYMWANISLSYNSENMVSKMRKLFGAIRSKFSKKEDLEIPDELEEGYVEINTEDAQEHGKAKITVRPFVLQSFEDIKPVLDALRDGYTIALVNIAPLKDKDLVELKRAINKLKKTCEALEGDIAGFGEDWVAVTPSFAKIHRDTATVPSSPAPMPGGDVETY